MPKDSYRTGRDLNRNALHRIHRIFELISSGKYPNCSQLAEEFERNPKTLQRDIDFMKGTMLLPIEYDRKHHGFYFSEAVTEFPLLKLTESELFAIFVGHRLLDEYSGTPFEEPLRNTFQHLTEGLNGELSFQLNELARGISFKSVKGHIRDPKVLQDLTLAIRQRSEIKFQYRKLKSLQFEHRHVQPYELSCVNGQWYLFSYDKKRGSIRTFAIPRMKNVSLTGVKFHKPKDFTALSHLRSSFGVFAGGEIKEVTIRFDLFGSQLVKERQWHPSQKITKLGHGRVQLTFMLGNFEEIEPWVLSWGPHAEVLSPPALIKRIRNSLNKSSALYEATPNEDVIPQRKSTWARNIPVLH